MSKKTLFIGAIASIIAINSVVADTTVTSKTYVDTQDALKQDKITAGTTGNVVLYNGTQNGQTQFSERAIYDGTNDYDETTDANKLITAGAVNAMAPELPTGTADTVVMYDNDGEIGGERGIYSSLQNNLDSYSGVLGNGGKLITAGAAMVRAADEAYVVANRVYNAMPTMTCVDADCTLFRIGTTSVRPSCVQSGDCLSFCAGLGYAAWSGGARCENRMCYCNLCRPDGAPCETGSQCCGLMCHELTDPDTGEDLGGYCNSNSD